MNKNFWKLYKDSPEGKACIALFDPEKEDAAEGIFNIWKHSTKWSDDLIEDGFIQTLDQDLWLWDLNFSERGFFPEEWNKESFMKFVEDFDILAPILNENGELAISEDNRVLFDEKICILKKDQYRRKAAAVSFLSMYLYFTYEEFKPILLPRRFDIIQRNCDSLGIEMPEIPRSNDYKAYLAYYYDICETWNAFQRENELTDAELCACIYDFASMYKEGNEECELPKPTNVWLTGASGQGDFDFLDSLGMDVEDNRESIWACNERTRRGDIIVIYCTSPRSYIHSIWKSNSGGIFNPFDYYHCRTTVCNGIRIPHITFNDLKNDEYMSQVPIVRRNLQGVNGIELSSEEYNALLRMIEKKGGDLNNVPKLYEGSIVDFGEITKEKHVEDQILIPMLIRLGYSETDWTRQLPLKSGRKEKAIPDFVFFPHGEKHLEMAPMVIEAKLDMSPIQEMQKAFRQAFSYAKSLRSVFMGICDKERLIIYKANAHGIFDCNNPIFEDHWAAIYADSNVGARLNQLIGKEVIKGLL